jgi:NACalpha-BTF3-like transcription factor
MVDQEQAKQLDSVTDNVKEAELDASKAQQAMSALSTAGQVSDDLASGLAAVAVSKDDVALIVSELEVTEEVAERALREVASEAEDGQMVVAALRRLVTG